MTSKPLPHWLGISLLVCVSMIMASNHVAARFAFDHGVSVVTAVAFRAGVTAVAVLALLMIVQAPIRLSALTVRRGILIGMLLVVQSYCLYSSVARIPVVLALLTFNIFPLMISLLTWLIDGKRPSRRLLIAMPIVLFGLSLALNVWGHGFVGHWAEIAAGVALSLTGAVAFSLAMVLTPRWLGDVDGRLRSCLTMATVAILAIVIGILNGSLALPVDHGGWVGLSALCLLYCVGITLLFVVLPRMGTSKYAAVLNFEPVAAMFLGWAILGQGVIPIQILGSAIVIGAIISISMGKIAPEI